MAPHITSHRAPCSCFPIKVSLQLSSEQSVGDVGITQLDWKRVSQTAGVEIQAPFTLRVEARMVQSNSLKTETTFTARADVRIHRRRNVPEKVFKTSIKR